MQRLVLAALLLAVVAGLATVFALGWRAVVREGGGTRRESEGSGVQKLAYLALILLIAGVSTGFLGGL